jgi:hypothetical protein
MEQMEAGRKGADTSLCGMPRRGLRHMMRSASAKGGNQLLGSFLDGSSGNGEAGSHTHLARSDCEGDRQKTSKRSLSSWGAWGRDHGQSGQSVDFTGRSETIALARNRLRPEPVSFPPLSSSWSCQNMCCWAGHRSGKETDPTVHA